MGLNMERLTSAPDASVVEVTRPMREIVNAGGAPCKAALFVAARSFKKVERASALNVSLRNVTMRNKVSNEKPTKLDQGHRTGGSHLLHRKLDFVV